MSHLSHTKNKVKNGVFSLICLKDVFVEFSWGCTENCTLYLCTPSLFFGYQDCQGEKGVQFSL